MRSGCLSTRWKQAASWRWPATTRRLRRARSTREMLQRNASQSAASGAASHSSGSGPRGTAPPTLIPHGKSVRRVGTCQSTATHRLRSLSGCPSRWTAWPRQGVHRPVEPELVVERRREDKHDRCEHSAGVVRHHERATEGGHCIEVAYLGAEVPLDDRAHPVLDLPGESGIPFGDLWLVRPLLI